MKVRHVLVHFLWMNLVLSHWLLGVGYWGPQKGPQSDPDAAPDEIIMSTENQFGCINNGGGTSWVADEKGG